jgi:hypothetical protein
VSHGFLRASNGCPHHVRCPGRWHRHQPGGRNHGALH